MRSTFLLVLILLAGPARSQIQGGYYTLVVEGFDWGAAASKVILHMPDSVEQVDARPFEVSVERSSPCMAEDAPHTSGKRDIVYAYVSDEQGNHVEKGKYVTLILQVGPYIRIDAPIQYFFGGDCRGNQWLDYKLTITNLETKAAWNREADRISPLVDEFDLHGEFQYKSEMSLRYAAFQPDASGKRPLIIWLHGGGEGGTDPSIVLLANRAANYASPEIQEIFGGAHVLIPQSPTRWMQSVSGETTRGDTEDIYHEALMALFMDYLKNNPDVDPERIYVGGCSNGGYMTQKLLLENPEFFAAAFPSALAYHAAYLSDADIATLAGQSIWYIHSKDDPVTQASLTVIPTYEKLLEAGAKDVHLSLYDHVIDLYGSYGGEDYHYNGHFSWVYSHRNHCRKVIEGEEITLMEWLSSKRR